MTWHKDVGKGPPVVLLHGGTGDPESYWSPQIPVLSERFRLILTQYPGYGDEAGGDAPFSIPACALHVRDLLDELGVERASLVGLSLGGAVSLQFALDHPERVRRLVLADTMSGVWTQKFRRFIDHALIGSIEQAGPDLMFELNLIFAFSERYLAENEPLFEQQKEAWRSIDVRKYTPCSARSGTGPWTSGWGRSRRRRSSCGEARTSRSRVCIPNGLRRRSRMRSCP